MKKENSEFFTMRLSRTEKESLELLGLMYGANASVIVRMCLREHVRDRFFGFDLPQFLKRYGRGYGFGELDAEICCNCDCCSEDVGGDEV